MDLSTQGTTVSFGRTLQTSRSSVSRNWIQSKSGPWLGNTLRTIRNNLAHAVDGRTVSNVSQILHPGDEILPEEVKSTSPNNDDLEERDLDSNLDLAKRQGCVGRVCIRSQYCVNIGCRLCMVSDRFIAPSKICV